MIQEITLYKITLQKIQQKETMTITRKKQNLHREEEEATAVISTDFQDTVIIIFSVSKIVPVTPKILPSSLSQLPAPKISLKVLNLLPYKFCKTQLSVLIHSTKFVTRSINMLNYRKDHNNFTRKIQLMERFLIQNMVLNYLFPINPPGKKK